MSIQGLWTAEFYGLHGWENTGVAVLYDGQLRGGGRHHYSVGTYAVSGDEVEVSIQLTYHGKPRVMFGSATKSLALEFKGKHREETIAGSINRVGSPQLGLMCRFTKRAEID